MNPQKAGQLGALKGIAKAAGTVLGGGIGKSGLAAGAAKALGQGIGQIGQQPQGAQVAPRQGKAIAYPNTAQGAGMKVQQAMGQAINRNVKPAR